MIKKNISGKERSEDAEASERDEDILYKERIVTDGIRYVER